MSKVHDLKILPRYFEAVSNGVKKFELRKDDRMFEVGDDLILNEWDGTDYSGRSIRCRVEYALRDCPGLDKDYVILGMRTL